MPDLLIHSPYADHAGQGNSVTAGRLEKIFSGAGYQVMHSELDYSGESADVMVALNARKSAKAIVRFRDLHPGSKLVIVLTGTDINHPDSLDEDSSTWASLQHADRLVVLHELSLERVPENFRDKTSVIYPSVTLPEDFQHMPGEDFTIVMAANMRKEKNPELAVSVAERLPSDLKVELYGEAGMVGSPKITLHGTVPHWEMLRAMSTAHVLLNTSLQEGGANAICEAICIGLPVVASAILGNVGMLGEDYVGLFPSNDVDALIAILEKAAGDPQFYAQMKEQIAARAPVFAYDQETASWRKLLGELSN